MKVICPDAGYVVALGRPVEAGETVDVPDTTGSQLVAQGWKQPKAAPAAKNTAKAEED